LAVGRFGNKAVPTNAGPEGARATLEAKGRLKLSIPRFLDSFSAIRKLRIAPKRCRESLPFMNPFATESGRSRRKCDVSVAENGRKLVLRLVRRCSPAPQMTTQNSCVGILLWLIAACCSGQAPDEWKTGEWKKFRSKRLNDCPTSITIQRMTDYKRKDIYWVSVSILTTKSRMTIKYDDIQFTALDENGGQMEFEVSDPLNEKKREYGKGLDTERLGFYHIPIGHRKLAAIKMAWNGKEVVFRMSDAMLLPQ
jgi:hypothetical protein